MSVINLTSREFVGVIKEVLKPPGVYKVIIDELVALTSDGGIIVRDESIPSRYTNSKVGTYGTFYPLQVGTKVTVRFKRNNLNSGVITGVLSYEHPAPDKHPNYYLLINTLSDSQIYIDDKEGKVEIDIYNGKSSLTLQTDKVKLHSGGENTVEAVDKVNVIASNNVYLAGGVSVSDSGGSSKLGPISNITYPVNTSCGDLGKLAFNTYAQPSKVSPELPESGTVDLSDQLPNDHLLDNYLHLNTNIPDYHQAEFDIITFDSIKSEYDSLSQQVSNASSEFEDIYNRANDITNTDLSDPIESNIVSYYNDLLESYNESAAAINDLRNSDEYNSLSDDAKSALDEQINIFTNILDQAKPEIQSIQTTFNYTDPLQDYPNYTPQTYDSVLDSYRKVYDELKNLDYKSTFDNLISTSNTLSSRYDSYSKLSSLSSTIHRTLDTVESTFVDDALNSLLQFKSKYYNTIDDTKINLLTSDKLLQSTLDDIIKHINGVKSLVRKIDYKQTDIKDTFPILSNVDSKIIDDITSYAYDRHISNLEDIVNSIIGKIPELRNSTTHNEFFNIFDSIYQDVYKLKSIQYNLAGDLKSQLYSINYNFNTLLYNTQKFTKNLVSNTLKNMFVDTYFLGKNLPPIFRDKLNRDLNELADCISDAVSDAVGALLDLIADDIYAGVRDLVQKVISGITKLNGILGKYFDYLLHMIKILINILLQHNGIHNAATNAIHDINSKYLCSIPNMVKSIGLIALIGKLSDNNEVNSFISNMYNKVSPIIPPNIRKNIKVSVPISNKDSVRIKIGNKGLKFKLV